MTLSTIQYYKYIICIYITFNVKNLTQDFIKLNFKFD